jgi:hypothetical protein
MRTTLTGSIGFLHAWTAASSAFGAATATSQTVAERDAMPRWRVGYAEADITPKPGEAMLAGFGQPRQVAGTLVPLRAQALAFEDGQGHRALLFTADVLGFGRASVDVLRRKIDKAYGIQPPAICFNASHTHWGPAINHGMNFALGGLDVWYLGRARRCLLHV